MTSLVIQPLCLFVQGKPRYSICGDLLPMSEGISYLCSREFCTIVLREYHDSLSYVHIYYTPSNEVLGGTYQPCTVKRCRPSVHWLTALVR